MNSVANDERKIVLFDAECLLCNGVVKWLYARDRDKRFEFAALQGQTAAELRAAKPDFPTELDTFVYWDSGEVRVRSRAAFAAAGLLPWPWSWARFLRWIPRFISDGVYRVIAHNRTKWFGRAESCWLPPVDERHRFLS